MSQSKLFSGRHRANIISLLKAQDSMCVIWEGSGLRTKFIKPLSRSPYLSPWLIIGAAVILLVVVLIAAVQDYHRQKAHMIQVLTEKGVALIKAVEAGARTGMRGMRWGSEQIQVLLEETARLPDVLYLAVIGEDGQVLAHSDPSRIGTFLPLPLDDSSFELPKEDNWQMTAMAPEEGALEVYRSFKPLKVGPSHRSDHRGMGRRHGRMMGWRANSPLWDEKKKRLIIAGLNLAPFKAAQRQEVQHTVVMSGLLLLLGFGGFISLFWAQNYRAARKSLQDTAAFANEVVSHLPIGLVATGKDDKIAFFNASAAKITGISRDQALGNLLFDVLPEDFKKISTDIGQGQRIFEQELEGRFEKQETVPLSLSATQIMNAEKEVVGRIFIMRDLREVRRLQAEVQRQEKLAAIGGLAAGVAHEIRNPLSSIKGMATYFRSTFPQGSDDRQAATVMVQEVDRLNRVISELIEFARPTRLNIKSTDIQSLLNHSLQLIQQDAEGHNVEVTIATHTEKVLADVDPDQLLQCLLNIYLNGFQAMPDGGTLSIAYRSLNNRCFSISIADTGQGIAPQHANKIFDPYFTTKASGTGLGLAIVNRIVEAHRGSIEVRSDVDKGTQITLIIPISG
jgi:two-component system sensor histidine kinase HydH